jgi:DNA-binding protein HU-beta
MNKSELIKEISKDANVSQKKAKIILEIIVSKVSNSLKLGEPVKLLDFGTWSVSKREGRKGRNPQTGKSIRIAAKIVVKFKASGNLLKDGGTDDGGPRSK